MSTQPPSSTTSSTGPQDQKNRTPSKEGKGKHVQEKIMFGLCLVFFVGVITLVYVPKQFEGPAMGLITFATIYAMFWMP